MANETCSVISGLCVVRLARLAADGTTPTGATNGYIAAGAIEATVTPMYQDGDNDLVVQAGDGSVHLDRKADLITRGAEVSIQFATLAPERMELLTAATLLTSAGGDSIGFALPESGLVWSEACGASITDGVSMEIWTEHFENNAAPARPFVRHVMPRLIRVQIGEIPLNRQNTVWTITGTAVDNPNFGDGPFNDITVNPSTRSYFNFGDTAVPSAICGYVAVPSQP